MVDIQSKEVIDKISDELKVQPSLEIPRELAKQIQLVYNVNPVRIAQIVRDATKTTTGTAALFTTPAERDFFLTSAQLNVLADVNADSTGYDLEVTIDGATRNIIKLAKITLTVFKESISLCFNKPIKLDRGSVILIRQAFTVGASVMGASITGFTTDPQ